jgi:hypothetical protein
LRSAVLSQQGQAVGVRMDDTLARQMLGQWPARRLASLECRDLHVRTGRRGSRNLGCGLSLRHILLEIGEL